MTLLVIVVGGAQTVVARGICQREIGQLQGGFGMLRPAVHPYLSPAPPANRAEYLGRQRLLREQGAGVGREQHGLRCIVQFACTHALSDRLNTQRGTGLA